MSRKTRIHVRRGGVLLDGGGAPGSIGAIDICRGWRAQRAGNGVSRRSLVGHYPDVLMKRFTNGGLRNGGVPGPQNGARRDAAHPCVHASRHNVFARRQIDAISGWKSFLLPGEASGGRGVPER